MSWTEERTKLAEKLWNDGKTATEIADRLGGVSRSAVLGKLHRGAGARPRRKPKPAPSQPWTQEREAKLREEWKNGHPLQYIANLLGTTQAAVAGKARQLGLPARQRAQYVPPRRPIERLPEPAKDEILAAGSRTIITAERHHCKWINDTPATAESKVCGRRTKPGSSYCPVHHARAWTPAPRRHAKRA